jgi:hypothetical protein
LATYFFDELDKELAHVIDSGENIKGKSIKDLFEFAAKKIYHIFTKIRFLYKGCKIIGLTIKIGALERKIFSNTKFIQLLEKKIQKCKDLDITAKNANQVAMGIVAYLVIVLELSDMALSIAIEFYISDIHFNYDN